MLFRLFSLKSKCYPGLTEVVLTPIRTYHLPLQLSVDSLAQLGQEVPPSNVTDFHPGQVLLSIGLGQIKEANLKKSVKGPIQG